MIADFLEVRMQKFSWVYLQGVERAVEDAKFLREVSARCRKSGLRMQNSCGEYPQVIEKARCRCNCT